MNRSALLGWGILLLLVAGPAAAGDEPKWRVRGVKSAFVPVKRPDRHTRLEILHIVRDAGHRDHAVRTRAFREWCRGDWSNPYLPLVTGLTFSSPRSRSFAAWALGEIDVPNAVEPLRRRSLVDEHATVRRTAIDSLRKLSRRHNLSVVRPMARSLRTGGEVTRMRAARALGDLGDTRAISYLVDELTIWGGPGPRVNIFAGTRMSYLQGYDVEVAQGAAIAKPRVGVITSGTVLDARVLRTQTRRRVYCEVVIRSLERLSSQRFGDDPAAWIRWHRGGGARSVIPASERARAPAPKQ